MELFKESEQVTRYLGILWYPTKHKSLRLQCSMRKIVSDDIEDKSGPSEKISSHEDRRRFPVYRELCLVNNDSLSNPHTLHSKC